MEKELRNLELRKDSQVPANNHIAETPICVLGMPPGSGKTETSIQSIVDYLELNPTHKVLVLAHSTNVLLMNYYNRLKEINLPFTYSMDMTDDSQVHVIIPQNETKIIHKYQYMIIDEAHHNYLGDRVQRIIAKVNPTKQLLLTGTPSKFVALGGYDIFAVGLNEIPKKYYAKLGFELVASNYGWEGHYNADHEVKKSFKYSLEDTEKTLESVLDALIKRIKNGFTAKEFNNPSVMTKLKSWAYTYNSIGKTIIACKSIPQANLTYKILQEKGVSSNVSHSENDIDSEIVVKFKNNEFDVLVVVDRCRLGYDDKDLVNIIDMTGSHNPDMIFQMLCRVVRGTPDQQKYFIKVTPKELHNMSLTHISVCAALMLTDKKYLTTYNGKNFNDWKIPMLKTPTTTISSNGDSNDGGDKKDKSNTHQNHFPEYTIDIVDFWKDVLCDIDKPASIYKMTSIGEVRYMLGHSKKEPIKSDDYYILESASGLV